MTLPLILYRELMRLLEPLAPRLLDARARKGKEDPPRLDERLGLTDLARPTGELVWLHGVSVGETLSLLPLVERVRAERPDLTVLVTSGTTTSAQLLARRLPEGAVHQYAPVDTPRAVRAFLDHWRPSVGVFVESDLWPNLISEAQARGVKLALASARITEKTANGWARWPKTAKRVLSAFSLVLPQDQASSDRLRTLGARIDGEVNLKLAGGPLPHDAAAFTRLSAAIGDRPVVVAASTHAGEEISIVRALDRLTERLCLILVPRHPERAQEIGVALRRDGYRFARRSTGEPLSGETDLYLADTVGEMGLFLRLADVVVMGGSFAPALGQPPVGGHNPLEPARLGKPAVTGPDAGNWLEVTGRLIDSGGLAQIQTPGDLPVIVGPLLADPVAAKAMGERARRAAQDAGSGLETLWAGLQPLLPPKPVARSAR